MRLTAEGVEISGFGAPFFTATAIHPLAIRVALPGTTLPEAITSASCGNSTIPTSNGSPLTIVSLDSMKLGNLTATLRPVFFSNCAISSLNPSSPRPTIVTESASCAQATRAAASAITITAIPEIHRFIVVSPMNRAQNSIPFKRDSGLGEDAARHGPTQRLRSPPVRLADAWRRLPDGGAQLIACDHRRRTDFAGRPQVVGARLATTRRPGCRS